MHKLRAFLLFLGCALLGMSAGSVLVLLIGYLTANIKRISSLPDFIGQVAHLPGGWYILIAVQAVSHLFSYLIPALVYWYLFEQRRWADFQNRSLKAVPSLWMGLLSVVVILPCMEMLIQWNQHLDIPRLLGTLGEWMQRKEQEGTLLTNQLVAFTSGNQLLIAILVIGVIASVGEEVFFRGIIQRKLIEWTASAHLGVWVAAILFSVVHFQFYGFFPRLVLGALFGYLYVWSGTIWVAILAHIVNNSLVIMTTYIQQKPTYLDFGFRLDTSSWIWVYFSAIGTTLLLVYFYRTNQKHTANLFRRPDPVSGQQNP